MPANARARYRANRKKAVTKANRRQLTKEERDARNRKIAKVVEYFNKTYGYDAENLPMWQLLCEHVGILPEPTIKECKEALKKIFLNIEDFVDARESGTEARKFATKQELRDYSISADKIFPLWEARQNGILKMLLIDMFSHES
ncbi:hypothetical protein LTR85_008476 [Meristemomyces frigidus]|nr:hypothetical protein LTR85_008476 [Meristemomyces frigidus]